MLSFLIKLGYLFCELYTDCSIAHDNHDIHSIGNNKKFYTENFEKLKDTYSFISQHIQFCFIVGDYDEIIDKYSQTRKLIAEKAKKFKDTLNNGNKDDLIKLRSTSKYSTELLVKLVKLYIEEEDYLDFRNEINTLLIICPEEEKIVELCAHFLFLCRHYNRAVDLLNSIGKHKISSDFLSIYNKFNDIKDEKSDFYKIKNLISYYKILDRKCKEDTFKPSIYCSFRSFVLRECVILGIECKEKSIRDIAKTYYEENRDDLSCYYYLVSLLLNSNNNQANILFDTHKWTESSYEAAARKKLRLPKKKKSYQNNLEKDL